MQENKEAEGVNQDSFEAQYDRLEELVAAMQSPSISLTDSFESYKQGMELVKSLNGMIDGIEKQVRELEESGDNADDPKEGTV